MRWCIGEGEQVCRPELRYPRYSVSSFLFFPIALETGLISCVTNRQILERSGVGSSDLLKKLDIKVVSDLPGVGYVPFHPEVVHHSRANSLSVTIANNIRTTTPLSPVCPSV